MKILSPVFCPTLFTHGAVQQPLLTMLFPAKDGA
jgi:hypothetical protein